jgi:UDP-xylose:glucoside alpha-1,3-xylosyltransferase
MYGSNCKSAEKLGAAVLHGCRRVFQNDKEVAFSQIYKAFQKVIVEICGDFFG